MGKGSRQRSALVNDAVVAANWGRIFAHDDGDRVGRTHTKRGRFCLAFGDDGCRDSRWVGGNYGSPVCNVAAHHKNRRVAKGTKADRKGTV